jgi:hypothetical protein
VPAGCVRVEQDRIPLGERWTCASSPSPAASRQFGELVVFDGFVEAADNSWIDEGRSLESFPLGTSRPHVEIAVYESVISQAKPRDVE